MAYLSETDYSKQIKSDSLIQIIGEDTSIRLAAELAAEAEIVSYLTHRYNISSELSKSGNNRNQQLVMFAVDIALYHLHSRINPRNIPQLRIDRYDSAIEWLKMAAKGTITAGIEAKTPEQGGSIRWGSNTKKEHNW
jgi:phage gp36-like protein